MVIIPSFRMEEVVKFFVLKQSLKIRASEREAVTGKAQRILTL